MEQIPFMGYYIRLLIMMNKFFDYMLLIFLILVMILAASCDVTDDEIIRLEPTLELDGRLPMDSNGYYRLELRQDVHQTIHAISGTVGNTTDWDEPMKVEWNSNLTWYLQDEVQVTTANPASYVVDGKVINVIGPVQTMVGDTLILTGTIREHLVSDTIKFVLE
jgi:hypothetical protein